MHTFYDFEFDENGETIVPISLGVVREDIELYFINKPYVERQKDPETRTCNDWVYEHVLPNLYSVTPDAMHTYELKTCAWGGILYNHLLDKEPLEKKGDTWKLVGYYADYDHVALAQLWGQMIMLPTGMPMWTRDLKQWIDDVGNPKIPVPKNHEHNAIADARWSRDAYKWLVQNYDHSAWRLKGEQPFGKEYGMQKP